MTNIVPMRNGGLTRRDPKRLELFARTVGKELRGDEIDEAIEWCEIYGANPFIKDIYFFVFDADNDKRRVVPVLGIGLYRKIAARTGDYRPDDQPARFVYDDTLKGPANPAGIVSCELSVFRYAHGEWHRVTERLRWDERAPIVEEGADGYKWIDTGEVWPDSGKPKKKRVQTGEIVAKLDSRKPNWRTMPETMLAKCVEAAAIRKAWPNETAGSYVEGELDNAQVIDLTATEIIEQSQQQARLRSLNAANALTVLWSPGSALEHVPIGEFGDKAIQFIQAHHDEPMTVQMWAESNRAVLREYFVRDKAGALEVKKAIERATAE